MDNYHSNLCPNCRRCICLIKTNRIISKYLKAFLLLLATMKTKILSITVLLFFITLSSCDTLNQVAQAATSPQGNPSTLEIGNGLKQALEIGTGKSSDKLSAVDGFLKNAEVKILFPPEAQKAERTLRSI